MVKKGKFTGAEDLSILQSVWHREKPSLFLCVNMQIWFLFLFPFPLLFLSFSKISFLLFLPQG